VKQAVEFSRYQVLNNVSTENNTQAALSTSDGLAPFSLDSGDGHLRATAEG
jgi:hypothetical protein